MEDHVYLDDRDQFAVIRSMETDLKALTALSCAMLRTLAAISPAVIHAVEDEARQAAKTDPVSASHVQALLADLSRRLTAPRKGGPDAGDLEWAPADPAAHPDKPKR